MTRPATKREGLNDIANLAEQLAQAEGALAAQEAQEALGMAGNGQGQGQGQGQ